MFPVEEHWPLPIKGKKVLWYLKMTDGESFKESWPQNRLTAHQMDGMTNFLFPVKKTEIDVIL